MMGGIRKRNNIVKHCIGLRVIIFIYSELPITRTSKGHRKQFELSKVRVIRSKLPYNAVQGTRKMVRLIPSSSYPSSSYRELTVFDFPGGYYKVNKRQKNLYLILRHKT